MRVPDVQQIAEAAGVDSAYYCLLGERHEALCLIQSGQVWRVFISDRGQRYEERSFGTEDEACVYFLKRLFVLWPGSGSNRDTIAGTS